MNWLVSKRDEKQVEKIEKLDLNWKKTEKGKRKQKKIMNQQTTEKTKKIEKIFFSLLKSITSKTIKQN